MATFSLQIAWAALQNATHPSVGEILHNRATSIWEDISAIAHIRARNLPREDYAISLPEVFTVDLIIWVPLTVVLGLGTFGVMFAFIVACDKV
jgi:hypothetical protein